MCYCVWIDVSTILFHYVVYALGSLDGTKQGCEEHLVGWVRTDARSYATSPPLASPVNFSHKQRFTSLRCSNLQLF